MSAEVSLGQGVDAAWLIAIWKMAITTKNAEALREKCMATMAKKPLQAPPC